MFTAVAQLESESKTFAKDELTSVSLPSDDGFSSTWSSLLFLHLHLSHPSSVDNNRGNPKLVNGLYIVGKSIGSMVGIKGPLLQKSVLIHLNGSNRKSTTSPS